MLSKKEVRLVDYLLAKQGDFVSSAELAKALGVSDRTARKYVQQLSLSLEASGASILSKQSKGYCLLVERPVEFEMFWQEQLRLKKQVTDLRQLEEATDRQRYVLSKLLFENPIQSMDRLQRELFIGKTTLHSIIADIRNLFAPYQLELLFTRRGGRIKRGGACYSALHHGLLFWTREWSVSLWFGGKSAPARHSVYGPDADCLG
ncbi:TPA: HTH domain-containing protein [Streptococcus suis]|nr:HTH domain-containing protein [Streptococcus suis]